MSRPYIVHKTLFNTYCSTPSHCSSTRAHRLSFITHSSQGSISSSSDNPTMRSLCSFSTLDSSLRGIMLAVSSIILDGGFMNLIWEKDFYPFYSSKRLKFVMKLVQYMRILSVYSLLSFFLTYAHLKAMTYGSLLKEIY